MGKFSKYDDIDALLAKCSSSLSEIEQHYENCLHQQTIPTTLLVEIKDFLGNLRSPLDYLNGKIVGSDRYFPICDQRADFQARYANIASRTLSVLEKWQPFNGHSWLKWFNILNNKNKHVALTPQKRTETKRVNVAGPDGSWVNWDPSAVKFGGGLGSVRMFGVPIDPHTQMPISNNVVETTVITWVDFVFDNSGELSALPANLSALGLLRESFHKVTAAIKEIEATLP